MRRYAMLLVLAFVALVMGCQSKQNSAPIPTGGGAPSPLAFQQEIDTLNKILAQDPKNLNALIKLGNIYMDTENFPKAVENYEKALAIDGKNMNVLVDMGTCYRRMGRTDKALEIFMDANKKDPNHAIGQLNTGVVLLYDYNKAEEALPYFEQFVKLSPASQQAEEVKALIVEIKRQTGK